MLDTTAWHPGDTVVTYDIGCDYVFVGAASLNTSYIFSMNLMVVA